MSRRSSRGSSGSGSEGRAGSSSGALAAALAIRERRERGERPAAAGGWPDRAQAYGLECILGWDSYNAAHMCQATRIDTGEPVTIRRVNLEPATYVRSADDYRHWEEEVRHARLSRLLQHENIYRAYTTFVISQREFPELWTVGPWLPQGSLRDLLDSAFPEGLEEPFVVAVTKQVLSGLSFLHRNCYVHGRISAESLVVTESGRVCLTNFQYTRWQLGPDNRRMSLHECPPLHCVIAWMAPELIAQDLRGFTEKADIYSLGITILELMQGEHPFAGLEAPHTFIAKLQGVSIGLSPSKKASKNLRAFIQLCIQSEPKLRPSAETLSAHALFKTLRKHPNIILKTLPQDTMPVVDLQEDEALAGLGVPEPELPEYFSRVAYPSLRLGSLGVYRPHDRGRMVAAHGLARLSVGRTPEEDEEEAEYSQAALLAEARHQLEDRRAVAQLMEEQRLTEKSREEAQPQPHSPTSPLVVTDSRGVSTVISPAATSGEGSQRGSSLRPVLQRSKAASEEEAEEAGARAAGEADSAAATSASRVVVSAVASPDKRLSPLSPLSHRASTDSDTQTSTRLQPPPPLPLIIAELAHPLSDVEARTTPTSRTLSMNSTNDELATPSVEEPQSFDLSSASPQVDTPPPPQRNVSPTDLDELASLYMSRARSSSFGGRPSSSAVPLKEAEAAPVVERVAAATAAATATATTATTAAPGPAGDAGDELTALPRRSWSHSAASVKAVQLSASAAPLSAQSRRLGFRGRAVTVGVNELRAKRPTARSSAEGGLSDSEIGGATTPLSQQPPSISVLPPSGSSGSSGGGPGSLPRGVRSNYRSLSPLNRGMPQEALPPVLERMEGGPEENSPPSGSGGGGGGGGHVSMRPHHAREAVPFYLQRFVVNRASAGSEDSFSEAFGVGAGADVAAPVVAAGGVRRQLSGPSSMAYAVESARYTGSNLGNAGTPGATAGVASDGPSRHGSLGSAGSRLLARRSTSQSPRVQRQVLPAWRHSVRGSELSFHSGVEGDDEASDIGAISDVEDISGVEAGAAAAAAAGVSAGLVGGGSLRWQQQMTFDSVDVSGRASAVSHGSNVSLGSSSLANVSSAPHSASLLVGQGAAGEAAEALEAGEKPPLSPATSPGVQSLLPLSSPSYYDQGDISAPPSSPVGLRLRPPAVRMHSVDDVVAPLTARDHGLHHQAHRPVGKSHSLAGAAPAPVGPADALPRFMSGDSSVSNSVFDESALTRASAISATTTPVVREVGKTAATSGATSGATSADVSAERTNLPRSTFSSPGRRPHRRRASDVVMPHFAQFSQYRLARQSAGAAPQALLSPLQAHQDSSAHYYSAAAAASTSNVSGTHSSGGSVAANSERKKGHSRNRSLDSTRLQLLGLPSLPQRRAGARSHSHSPVNGGAASRSEGAEAGAGAGGEVVQPEAGAGEASIVPHSPTGITIATAEGIEDLAVVSGVGSPLRQNSTEDDDKLPAAQQKKERREQEQEPYQEQEQYQEQEEATTSSDDAGSVVVNVPASSARVKVRPWPRQGTVSHSPSVTREHAPVVVSPPHSDSKVPRKSRRSMSLDGRSSQAQKALCYRVQVHHGSGGAAGGGGGVSSRRRGGGGRGGLQRSQEMLSINLVGEVGAARGGVDGADHGGAARPQGVDVRRASLSARTSPIHLRRPARSEGSSTAQRPILLRFASGSAFSPGHVAKGRAVAAAAAAAAAGGAKVAEKSDEEEAEEQQEQQQGVALAAGSQMSSQVGSRTLSRSSSVKETVC